MLIAGRADAANQRLFVGRLPGAEALIALQAEKAARLVLEVVGAGR